MAASLGLLLSLLRLGTLSAQELASKQVPPHLTGCVSNDMETFRCTWSAGSFQNVSWPGDLRLFYVTANQNHTSIWTSYIVQLCSRDRAVVYDEFSFYVEGIVQPDPPVSLNWTLLSVSFSGTHFDVRLRWAAPQTADVSTGWMSLQYEVQHREGGGAPWKTKELQRNTDTSLYGLQTNVEHEVRVRSKMLSSKEFGAFSDSILIHVPSKGELNLRN
ncbi:hypothetical protein CRUP_013188 [Coryphaenoides rupestris]|nr:hypothetical protein CRUP_013188 [Coryphaenoides rupestris]